MTAAFTESVVEEAALGWLEALGCLVLHGPDIAAGERAAEHSNPYPTRGYQRLIPASCR